MFATSRAQLLRADDSVARGLGSVLCWMENNGYADGARNEELFL